MKYAGFILLGLIFLISIPLGAQSSSLYAVSAGSMETAGMVRRELESRFESYNRLFRFDPSLLEAPMNVRVFRDKYAYDSYVQEHLGNTIDGAIYLHYEEPGRRELVIHWMEGPAPGQSAFDELMLAHQSFVQYFRAFIPDPPSWFYESNFVAEIIFPANNFAALMEEGHAAYSRGDLSGAELLFLAALERRPHDFAPYYYLGLIAYTEDNFTRAEELFMASEERGADRALISFALGINALAAGRAEEAAAHLHLAAGLDPPRFRTQVEEILRQIWR